MHSRVLAFVSAIVIALTLAASAADRPKARFSDEFSYTGPPKLALTLAMIQAGGGAKDFSAQKLINTLAGSGAPAEVEKLTKQFGAQGYSSFITVFDFVAGDRMHIVSMKHIAMPKAPAVAPSDGKALAAALLKAGTTSNGRFDVEYLLDSLDSHINHVEVMDDIDKKFGRKADAGYHVLFATLMIDLKAQYKL